MTQSNLAEQIFSPEISVPLSTQNTRERTSLLQKLYLSGFEKLIIVAGLAITFVLLLGIVTVKIQLSNAAANATVYSKQLSAVQTHNELLREERAELLSHDRLVKYAAKNNMQLDNKAIKSISEK